MDCTEFTSKLPKDFFTGFVTVPENWENPSGRKIDIFYYGRDLNPNNSTIAFFNGGPAASSHGAYETLNVNPDSAKINLIYIDQRGTGCSDPFPAEPTLETAERLTHYTSRSIVLDAEEIRVTLLGKNTKWKIFGQSYGGLIVHRYLSMKPESIVSAYAHGYSIMTNQTTWMKDRISSQNRVIKDYFKNYPQDKADLEKIKTLIPKNQCIENNGMKLCGPVIVDLLRHPLGFQDSWEEMHWWIENLAKSLIELPNLMVGFSNMYLPDFTNDTLASGIINRIEISKGKSDKAECFGAFSRLKAIGENPDLWPINECRVVMALQSNHKNSNLISSVKQVDATTLESVKNSLLKHPQVELYLYSGQKDVFVPVETFAEEVKALGGRIKYQSFSDSGHEGFHTEKQIWDDLLK